MVTLSATAANANPVFAPLATSCVDLCDIAGLRLGRENNVCIDQRDSGDRAANGICYVDYREYARRLLV